MYSGQTYSIPCSRGGLTGNPNIDEIAPYMMLWPSRNLNLHRNGREPRGGTSHVWNTARSGTPQCMGLYDFQLRNGTQQIVSAWDDGTVQHGESTSITTGLSTTNYFNFETGENKLFICDGTANPQVWTGAACAEIANVATSWGTNQVFQMVKHGRGASERMWAVALDAVYASKLADMEDFSDAEVKRIAIDTSDGFGLVGMAEFYDRLVVFGKRKAYFIDDADASSANWGYEASPWEGGAANWRLIVKTPNDLLAMAEDGDIYSVTAVQESNDYRAASLTRPAKMDEWIRQYVDLSDIAKFHAVYDPALRAVKWFVVRSGQTAIDTALVFYIDRPLEEAWMVHDNQSADSGYSASASALIRKATGNYKVYTGDYGGYVWELETANKNDNTSAYYAGFKTPHLPFDNARILKNYNSGWIVTEPKGDWNLAVNMLVDGKNQLSTTVSLAGVGSNALDTFVLDTDTLGGQELIDSDFPVSDNGKRIQFEFYNSTVDQSFFVSEIRTDFIPLGA